MSKAILPRYAAIYVHANHCNDFAAGLMIHLFDHFHLDLCALCDSDDSPRKQENTKCLIMKGLCRL
jgi:hypothetical protein